MKKILITGGAGFVGRYFTKFFLDKKYKVIVVDNIEKYTGGLEPSKWPLYIPLDYKNFSFVKEDCRDWFKNSKDKDYDYVFHLAAKVGGRQMIENSPIAIADDLSIDSHFWQWATSNKPKKVITFSSSACYPVKYQTKDNHILLKESLINFNEDIGIPDLTYGWAKLTSEYLGLIAHQKYGINSACYRPFSGYGKDQDSNYPFPSICQRVMNNLNKKKIEVWGSGDQERDFIHIEDCVLGVTSTMDLINDGSAMNLSTGKLTNFKQFTKIAANILGFDPEVSGLSDKPEGVFSRGGDTELQKKMGFINKIKFEDGIKDALSYYHNLR